MGYHRILAAFDGSEVAEKALRQAIGYTADHPGSRLFVVYVRHRQTFAALGFGYAIPDGYEKELHAFEGPLVKKVGELTASLPYAQLEILTGDPASEIVKFAGENRCDLIVIGSRGLGSIKEWMLGSVSHHVVHRACLPVLIVK